MTLDGMVVVLCAGCRERMRVPEASLSADEPALCEACSGEQPKQETGGGTWRNEHRGKTRS